MQNTKREDKLLVTEHIQKLESELALVVEAARQLILSSHTDVGERIKWNNPSFYYKGSLPDFDPKEYKRDIAVFNLHKGRIMLVFPGGAKLENGIGLLEGKYPDGRRLLIIKNMADLKLKAAGIHKVINEWIELVGK